MGVGPTPPIVDPNDAPISGIEVEVRPINHLELEKIKNNPIFYQDTLTSL